MGLPRRILISVLGLGTAILSITGAVIWWKKRVAYARREQQQAVESPIILAT